MRHPSRLLVGRSWRPGRSVSSASGRRRARPRRSSVLWPVRLRKTSSRLGSRSASPAIAMLRRIERAQHVGARLGSVLDRQLDHEVLDDRRLLRQRRQQRNRPSTVVALAERDRDHRGAQVRLELGRGPLAMTAPVVDDHDVAGQPVRLFEVLGGQQHRGAPGDQLLDDAPQALSALGVQAGRRLVEEEDGWVGHQRSRQVQPPAHAARIGLEDAVAGVGQAELLEQLVRPPCRHAAAQVGEPRHHVDVLPAGEVLVHRGVLAGQPDGAPDGVGLGDHVVARGPRRDPRRDRGWWRGCARRSSCRPRSGRAARARCRPPPPGRRRRGPGRCRGGRP